MLVVPNDVKEAFTHIPTRPSCGSPFLYKDNPDAYKDGYLNGERAMNSRLIG